MSQENVELAQRLVDAMNRRDAETLAALSDPDMEFRSALSAVDANV